MTLSAPTDLLRQALAAARANDRARTRELLLEVTRLDPRNEAAWHWLAAVAESGTEAVHALERAVALNPANTKGRAALREVRLQAGIDAAKAKDIPTAQRLLRAAVADDPRSELGWFWLAAVCESPHEAISYLQRVLALNPNNAPARKGIEYYQAKLRRASESGAIRASATIRAMGLTREVPTPPQLPEDSGLVRTPPPQTTPPPPSRKLLVAETSRTIRKLVAMTAAPEGFTVVEAADATEAASLMLEGGPPDLILVDAALGGVDGYEFCKLIRNNPGTRRVPVILLVGKEGLSDKIRGAMVGVDAILSKPLDADELLRTLRTHCPVEVGSS